MADSQKNCWSTNNRKINFQIKLVNINSSDLVDGRPPVVLGLIWTIILYFQVNIIKNMKLLMNNKFKSLPAQIECKLRFAVAAYTFNARHVKVKVILSQYFTKLSHTLIPRKRLLVPRQSTWQHRRMHSFDTENLQIKTATCSCNFFSVFNKLINIT